MNEREKLVIVGVAIIALVTFSALSIYWEFSPIRSGQVGMMNDMNREFIENMVPHHQDAVEMSAIALVKAEHPEIKQLAENITISQSSEIEDMRSWYKSWYGTDVPSNSNMMGFGMGMMGNRTDLKQLENAQPFDKEFIEQMIPHHQMGIMMAKMVLVNSNRQEIRSLAESIIKTQSLEIEEMRNWYRNWYGVDVPVS
jgi:uncharacterized protein (DUF305 family)